MRAYGKRDDVTEIADLIFGIIFRKRNCWLEPYEMKLNVRTAFLGLLSLGDDWYVSHILDPHKIFVVSSL